MQIWEAASFTHLLLFSIKRVGPDPRVWDGESRCQVEGWQEGGEGPFQEVRVPTHRVLCLAQVRALGKKAHVAGWEEKREDNRERSYDLQEAARWPELTSAPSRDSDSIMGVKMPNSGLWWMCSPGPMLGERLGKLGRHEDRADDSSWRLRDTSTVTASLCTFHPII